MAGPAFLGVLMLQTRFPRPPGDIGNPATFEFPVRYTTVAAATPQRVVRGHAEGLLSAFIAAGQQLVAEGAVALSTSCGFLALHQRELAAALAVPIATSSLLQLTWLRTLYPGDEAVGVLTIDAASLGPEHLQAVGADLSTPIQGVDPACEFARRILADEATLDIAQAERDVVTAAIALRQRVAGLRAIVLECTNMPPYAAAVVAATGCAVYDIVGLCRWLWEGAGHHSGGARRG
jgi:hypothetical protein